LKQKEIWLANLNPTRGREQRGIRPVLIISGNEMNAHSSTSIVCPVTSKIKNFAGCLVIAKNKTNGLKQDSEILTHQIRMISQERLLQKWGAITDDELKKVIEGLNEILTY
jgi:mRNA interferase MazF